MKKFLVAMLILCVLWGILLANWVYRHRPRGVTGTTKSVNKSTADRTEAKD